MKSISTIIPAITKNMECLIAEACTPDINLKVGMSLITNGKACLRMKRRQTVQKSSPEP